MRFSMFVMLTDVLLLDFFNSMKLPTSTTISIVFELLGASLAMSFLHVLQLDQPVSQWMDYINTGKALEMIIAIFVSVAIAFLAGGLAAGAMLFLNQRSGLKEDTIIGLIFTSFFGLGLFMVSLNPTSVSVQQETLDKIAEVVAEVEDWASTEYVVALMKGDRLEGDEFEAARLEALADVEEWVREHFGLIRRALRRRPSLGPTPTG